jgi:hypothetical protein
MKKLFLIFSHKLTNEQIDDAKNSLNIEKFEYLPKELQIIWSNIPTDLKSLDEYLNPIKEYLKKYSNNSDYVLIQGEFGAVYNIVNYSKTNNLIPIYSTTKRVVSENIVNGIIEKKSIFSHVIFREYL